MGSMLSQNHVIAKDVKTTDATPINSISRGNALAPSGKTHYDAHVGLPDKVRAIKGLVVCNNWDLEPFGPRLLSTVFWGIKWVLKCPVGLEPPAWG